MRLRTTLFLAMISTNVAGVARAQAVVSGSENEATVSKNHPIVLSVGYSGMISNAPPGQCGCFLMNGGSGEALFQVWKNFAAVVQLTGDHAGSVPQSQQPFSLVTTMAGPRYSTLLPKRVTVYGQFLAGRAHGFDTYFPRSDAQPNNSADSIALAVGGGVEIGVKDWLSIRPVAAEFLSTRLPNDLNGYQRNVRFSSGLVVRFSTKVLNR
jgi:hypothetical protein